MQKIEYLDAVATPFEMIAPLYVFGIDDFGVFGTLNRPQPKLEQINMNSNQNQIKNELELPSNTRKGEDDSEDEYSEEE
jgi:hypothetical protein